MVRDHSDTIMVKEYRMGKWKREGGWFMGWGERQVGRGQGSEEQTNVNGLLGT